MNMNLPYGATKMAWQLGSLAIQSSAITLLKYFTYGLRYFNGLLSAY